MCVNNDNLESKKFVSLLVPNQRRIQAFILMLVPNISDADDIYQETLTEMWNKFSTFQEGTDFVAWAITIVQFHLKQYNQRSIKFCHFVKG